MAIAFDSKVDLGYTAAGTSITANLTVVSSTDTYLFVAVHCRASTPGVNPVASVTAFKGGSAVGMVIVANDSTGPAQAPYYWTEVYGMKLPDTGSHAIVVTTTGTEELRAHAVCYSGVDQTTPVETGAVVGHVCCDPSYSDSLTTLSANAWFVGFFTAQYIQPQAGSGLVNTRYGTNKLLSVDSGVIASAGAYPFTVDSVGGAGNAHGGLVFALKPSAGGGGATPWLFRSHTHLA